MSKPSSLTDLAPVFIRPRNATHRQYEALRAYFVDGERGTAVAERFGYTTGSFRMLVHQFRQDPDREFFATPLLRSSYRPISPVHDQIIKLRKQNLSIYDISESLKKEGIERTPVAVNEVLKKEGFAKLPRRLDEERPEGIRPTAADRSDVRLLNLERRSFRTKYGGLFLFLPAMVSMGFDRVMGNCGLPGTKMIPAAHAMRSLLALKLFATQRHTHVMSAVLDEGLALFAGLNVIPKRSFLTEYSCRINPKCYPKLMRHWFNAMTKLGLEHGASFDLDFHTIPFHGDDALMEKHYVSKRSRRQKGILAFLAQDGDKRFFCYANSDLRKDQQNDEILAFAHFWKKRTGTFPDELIFDSKLTTYRKLNELEKKGIHFITLRRRSSKMVDEAFGRQSAWRRIELRGVSRIYKTPRIIDEKIALNDYDHPIRQIIIRDLGHEEPTFLMTNQLKRSATQLIERYAKRMLIENNIEDSINFFHMDALSSAVAMKINCDLQLTLMGSSLYRHLAQKIGNGYETAKSRHLFQDLVDATARVEIDKKEIVVQFQKRAHNPLLIAAGFDAMDLRVPWLGRKKMRFQFG